MPSCGLYSYRTFSQYVYLQASPITIWFDKIRRPCVGTEMLRREHNWNHPQHSPYRLRLHASIGTTHYVVEDQDVSDEESAHWLPFLCWGNILHW